ncbi:unnamed protein product [Schistocephalus solidus]|uniref:DUF4238 domain-containing protein n=1 Tax=Schistocephalus solidus TaxID=70667 RepID=A0A183TMK0_SCHSO|nr:unnamed protein product [Schistocephalus solidus]
MSSCGETYTMAPATGTLSGEFVRPGTRIYALFQFVGDDIQRLALRISLADIDEQFEKVIHKSLVFILRYLAKFEDHRKKLLGDVTRRLKCRPAIQIPVHELFVAYNDPECSTYLTNFSHMYIRMGYPRMPLLEQIRLLPVFLLHLTLPVIGHVTVDNCSRREMELHELPVQRRFISEFYSLVLLLPYRFERLIRFDSNDATIPDGFNAYDYSRVAHDRFSMIHSAEDLEKFKVAVVNFFSRGFFPADESILPLLFANADTRHSVVSASDRQLHILDRLVDWEDEALLTHIFDWFLGRRREFDPKVSLPPRWNAFQPKTLSELNHSKPYSSAY